MPSPFPGMDPYLEGSEWRSVHNHLSVEIARHLTPKLRPKYFVRAAKNYLTASEEEPQITVEVHDVFARSLVTVIKVLSLSSKSRSGQEGYPAQGRRLARSRARLMEIDLLRGGERMRMLEPLPDASYFVILSRADQRPIAEVWPIDLRSSLPTVPVPLLPDDPDVVLDLQQVLTSMYSATGADEHVRCVWV